MCFLFVCLVFFFLKGYLRPIFSLIVLNVFFVCLVGFFTGKYTAYKDIEKKLTSI